MLYQQDLGKQALAIFEDVHGRLDERVVRTNVSVQQADTKTSFDAERQRSYRDVVLMAEAESYLMCRRSLMSVDSRSSRIGKCLEARLGRRSSL
jgi:uncharacterized metal-binding protein YceD (DUF177 family)